ncbi:transposase [Serratia fonticola]|uniref:transposase n=1 Tax=Serratia fonticola TaxID=47917 RepID=UPI003593E075
MPCAPLIRFWKTGFRHASQPDKVGWHPTSARWRRCRLCHKSLIEKFFAQLKQYLVIATRYDKTACSFLGASHLAAAIIWLN